MEFKRPIGLHPMVYATFKLKSKNGKYEEQFLIQDLTENYFDDAVKIIVENHAKGAVFHKAARTLSGESGLRSVSEMYRNVFKEKISLICLTMDTLEIVGLNALTARECEVKSFINFFHLNFEFFFDRIAANK